MNGFSKKDAKIALLLGFLDRSAFDLETAIEALLQASCLTDAIA